MLDRILGVLELPREVAAEGEDRRVVVVEDLLEGTHVTGPHPRDQSVVGASVSGCAALSPHTRSIGGLADI